MGLGWPARIPWEPEEGPPGEPRFICDVMVEGLARQLRLCGIDAAVAPNLAKSQRFLTYRCVSALPVSQLDPCHLADPDKVLDADIW
jgi:Mut7-C RNAse domain